jgi:V8-like Glu-specific endopeptidase
VARLLALAVLAVPLLVACGGPGSGGDTPPRPLAWSKERMLRIMKRLAGKGPGAEPPEVLAARVGALFYNDIKGDHYCTAGVVDSPHGDLVITAAHCLYGNGSYVKDVVFVPDFRAGSTPYGVWSVAAMFVDDRWTKSSDPNIDVGFAVVKPDAAHSKSTIQKILGANKLAVNDGFDHLVEVTGYPSDADQPVSCITRSKKQDDHQLRFDCDHFFGGTSGAPWITDYDPYHRSGKIVGVIGGFEAGGDTDAVSYSSYFDSGVQDLYDRAVKQG